VSGSDLAALRLSVVVAVLATAAAFLTGVPLAWLLGRRRFRGRTLLEVLVLLPMVLPPTVVGYYLLLVAGRRGALGRLVEAVTGGPLVFTPAAAVLATYVAATPFLVRAAQGGFEHVDPVYEDARARSAARRRRSSPRSRCRSRGAGSWPGWRSASRARWASSAPRSCSRGDIPGRTQTASMAVYDAVQSGDLRRAAALALLLSVAAGGALAALTAAGRGGRGDR
jgi:molybdate transport system permease protein